MKFQRKLKKNPSTSMRCQYRLVGEASSPEYPPYIKEQAPDIEVIGIEADGARSMKAAFEAGGPVKLKQIDKFADGIAVQKVGQLTYEATKKKC